MAENCVNAVLEATNAAAPVPQSTELRTDLCPFWAELTAQEQYWAVEDIQVAVAGGETVEQYWTGMGNAGKDAYVEVIRETRGQDDDVAAQDNPSLAATLNDSTPSQEVGEAARDAEQYLGKFRKLARTAGSINLELGKYGKLYLKARHAASEKFQREAGIKTLVSALQEHSDGVVNTGMVSRLIQNWSTWELFNADGRLQTKHVSYGVIKAFACFAVRNPAATNDEAWALDNVHGVPATELWLKATSPDKAKRMPISEVEAAIGKMLGKDVAKADDGTATTESKPGTEVATRDEARKPEAENPTLPENLIANTVTATGGSTEKLVSLIAGMIAKHGNAGKQEDVYLLLGGVLKDTFSTVTRQHIERMLADSFGPAPKSKTSA